VSNERSPRPGHDSGDDLEELSHDAIIAQEAGVHAPQPRVHVATDAPTVVISEPPPRSGQPSSTVPPSRRRGEQTVVIRDRRALEDMRKAIRQRRPVSNNGRIPAKTYFLLGAAVLVSLALGTLLAVVVERTQGSVPAIQEARQKPSRAEVVAPDVPAADAPAAPSAPARQTIDLDE
jgi:hypothetical protein